MGTAFTWLGSKGVCLTSSYKYTAKDGSCKETSCSKSKWAPKGHTSVSRGSTSSLSSAGAKQPISIAVDANNW